MKAHAKHRFLCLLLTVLMLVSLFPTAALAAEVETSTWEKVDFDKITADDVVAITMTKGSDTWALPTAGKGGNGQPLAVAATVDGDKLSIDGAKDDFGWTITANSDSTFAIKNAAGESLYVTATNNGVRIGKPQSGKEVTAQFSLKDGYLTASDGTATRYLGVYNNQDWRCYAPKSDGTLSNIGGQTIAFWKYTGSSSGEQEVTITPIADALAQSTGSFTVKGVVTLIDGRNVYVQDATGGIDLYLTAAPTDLALGDTVLGTGTRAAYNGLQELTNGTYTKDEGLTLAAKETTLGALTEADVCTYVTIKDLEVLAVDDSNITVQDADGVSINIYKPVLGDKTVAEGDKLDFTGAVGYFKGFQLRNTVADEIVVREAPYKDVPANLSVYEKTAEIADGDRVVIFNADAGQAAKAEILSSYYLYGEAVTPEAERNIITSDNDLIEWTVKVNEDGTYTFTNGDNTLAGKQVVNGTKTNNNITFSADDNAKWVLTVCNEETGSWYIYNADMPTKYESDGGHIYLEWYAKYNEFSLFDTSRISEPAFGMTFYKLVREKTVETPETPTASPAAGAVEAGTEVTFSCATEGAVISYSTDNGATWTEGTTLTVNEAVTVLVKAVKAGAESETASFAYTIKSEEPAAETGIVTDLSQLTDGAKVVILNPANNMALSQNYNGNYNAGVPVALDGDKLTGYGATEIWTVGVNEDGTYTFSTADGKKLSMDTQYSSLPLDKVNANWTVIPAEGGFYIENTGRTGYRVEWYADKNNWSAYYKNNDGDLFIQQFYLVGDETPDVPTPTGDTYGLASKLATGDKVILFNAQNGVAVGNTIASHKITGVALTPADGVITTDNEAVVWTVTVNADGTYTFTQGDYTLGGVVSGTYNNLVVTGATSVNWTPTGPDSSDFNYFLRLDDMSNNFGKMYMEYYNGFTLYGSSAPTKEAFGITFYKQGAEPETPSSEPADKGDLVTNLDDMVGKTVAIYSPGHQTAISSKPNGDWYLKAQNATVTDGKVVNFTSDFVWTVTKNDDGTYSFVSYDDPTKIIGVWPSGNYAEVTVNPRDDAATAWTLTPAKTADCFYMNSPTVSGSSGPAYIEAYVRNEFEVFSGYFTKPTSNKFVENEFALQFYLVDPADAVAAMDDGEWDGVLTKGAQYVIYNADAKSSIGLFDEANFSMKAIPTTITGDKAEAGNGAYVFTVDTMGRYYTFKTGDKFLATNNDEELFLIEPNADGSAPETAKWFLNQKSGGYILYNKEASYNGTPVCIEYYSSVFSGWTFSTKNPVEIYLFNFYPVADGTKVYNDIVQDPTVKFDGENIRYIEQDYTVEAALDDLAPDITSVKFSYAVGEKTGEITNVTGNDRTFSLTIPAADLDSEAGQTSFTVKAEVTNSYGITYTGEKTVTIVDEPFFSDLTPRPNAQTGENKQPVISVKIGNVGADPTFTMQVNGKTVEATFADGVLSYTPAAELADGRVTVDVSVKRADNVSAEKSWSFIVGSSAFQHYFGQLHSHTTYSDGSGTLDAALEYVAGLPKSANVQFVAFTDHSNYFDTTSAANPEDALNDKSLMTDASREKWETYKNTVAAFNESHDDILAIAGFEMTWSGGPGHINTFDSDGLVSRNNAALNNKTGDAGMKLYYATINKGESLNQFNHPGTTFGNFTDFSYYDAETDAHMFLVEVGNGEGQIGAGGYYPSYEQYTMALDKGWHVAPTNNQDNHKGRWGNANDARDVVLATDLSEESLYDAIRALRVYATEDKNLDLNYTVNDEPMGTIFTEAPEQLAVKVNVFDPDTHESIQKVELIANSGKVAYTWDNATEIATGELTATLDPTFSYYYVRVTQADGDLAVTAPVWVGESISVGIQDVESKTAQPIVNEPVNLQTTLFNNESSDVKVKSLVYTVDGAKVIGTDTTGYTIPANGTVDVPFTFTPDVAKRMTIKVTAVIEVNGGDLTYTKDLTISVRETAGDLPVTDIKDVQAQTEAGHEYAIEGIVTSNASGYDKDTAFFDCIYVQDETAGICCFPVSGEFKVGDKVHIEGYTDFYQGEAELQVEKIEVIGSGEVAPKETTAAAVNDGSVLGSLITVKGTVESFEVVNGLVQTIMVKDEKGDVVRVFIDGYITTGSEVKDLADGCKITVTGLASYDDTFNAPEGPFPRIRIRDRADVVCEPKTPEKCDGGDNCPSKDFTDVDRGPDSWYHEPVDWAVVAKVTNGTSPTTFSPDDGCTRAQAVTMLYRAKGEPAVKATACDFVDVPADAYYYKAVLWAVENGITNGVDATHFNPDDTCTRAHIVTFLFRAENGKAGTDNPFVDVPAGEWFTDAVLWANAEGITNGVDPTHFAPMSDCTRAQIVTFLYRDMAE